MMELDSGNFSVCLKYAKFKVVDISPQDMHFICQGLDRGSKGTFLLPIDIPPFNAYKLYRFVAPSYLKKQKDGHIYDKYINGKPYSVHLGMNFSRDGIYHLIPADIGYANPEASLQGAIECKADKELDLDLIEAFLMGNEYEGIQVGGITIPYAYRQSTYNDYLTPIDWAVFKRTGIDKWHVDQLFTIVHIPETGQMFRICVKHIITVQKYVLFSQTSLPTDVGCIIDYV